MPVVAFNPFPDVIDPLVTIEPAPIFPLPSAPKPPTLILYVDPAVTVLLTELFILVEFEYELITAVVLSEYVIIPPTMDCVNVVPEPTIALPDCEIVPVAYVLEGEIIIPFEPVIAP